MKVSDIQTPHRLDQENKTGFLSSYTHQTFPTSFTDGHDNICDPNSHCQRVAGPVLEQGCARGTFWQDRIHVCVASRQRVAEDMPADPTAEHSGPRRGRSEPTKCDSHACSPPYSSVENEWLLGLLCGPRNEPRFREQTFRTKKKEGSHEYQVASRASRGGHWGWKGNVRGPSRRALLELPAHSRSGPLGVTVSPLALWPRASASRLPATRRTLSSVTAAFSGLCLGQRCLSQCVCAALCTEAA